MLFIVICVFTCSDHPNIKVSVYMLMGYMYMLMGYMYMLMGYMYMLMRYMYICTCHWSIRLCIAKSHSVLVQRLVFVDVINYY